MSLRVAERSHLLPLTSSFLAGIGVAYNEA